MVLRQGLAHSCNHLPETPQSSDPAEHKGHLFLGKERNCYVKKQRGADFSFVLINICEPSRMVVSKRRIIQ
jgi:hypothetical protein